MSTKLLAIAKKIQKGNKSMSHRILGRNTIKNTVVIDFELLYNNEMVLVTFEGGLTQKLGVFHLNIEAKSILCDDFETFINY